MQQVFQCTSFPSWIENTTLLCFFKEELTKKRRINLKIQVHPFCIYIWILFWCISWCLLGSQNFYVYFQRVYFDAFVGQNTTIEPNIGQIFLLKVVHNGNFVVKKVWKRIFWLNLGSNLWPQSFHSMMT